MTSLPRIASMDDYRPVFRDDDVWRPAIRAIAERHELGTADLRRAGHGSHIVWFAGDRVIKLFCPIWPGDWRSERGVLAAGVRGLPLPELVAEGEVDGWRYVVITVVPGRPAGHVWPDLDANARADVITQMGEMMRTLHATPAIPELATDWDAFLAERIAKLDAQHAQGGEQWQRAIGDRVGAFSHPSFEPVLLSADLTDDHLLLSEHGGRWTITGLIDFGDAMMGPPHYEFIAPLAFYTFGNPALGQRLVEAYGWELTPELSDVLTSYCLLHKYGHIGQFLERAETPDMHAFRDSLFPHEPA